MSYSSCLLSLIPSRSLVGGRAGSGGIDHRGERGGVGIDGGKKGTTAAAVGSSVITPAITAMPDEDEDLMDQQCLEVAIMESLKHVTPHSSSSSSSSSSCTGAASSRGSGAVAGTTGATKAPSKTVRTATQSKQSSSSYTPSQRTSSSSSQQPSSSSSSQNPSSSSSSSSSSSQHSQHKRSAPATSASTSASAIASGSVRQSQVIIDLTSDDETDTLSNAFKKQKRVITDV